MNKNPFSIYDFLGYLFPGLVALMAVTYVAFSLEQSVNKLFSITNFKDVFTIEVSISEWQSTVVIIILSYIAGHIVAYLSSVVVEKFSNRLFKYPSLHLIHATDDALALPKPFFARSMDDLSRLLHRYFRLRDNWGMKNWGSFLWRVVIGFVLLPISVPMIVGIIFSINRFIARPLDEYVRNSIVDKLNRLAERLKITLPDVNSEDDFHRIVMHYVYLNIPNCQRKVDNYVAMYGFLRAMTLIACLLFDYLFFDYLFFIGNAIFVESQTLVFDSATFLKFIFLIVVCNLLFLGFVKYYRRFTLENFMALLTEKE